MKNLFSSMEIKGNIVDIHAKKIFYGSIKILDGKIDSITELEGQSDFYILPGFVDAHVHIESSMLIPSEFAKLAVIHGTVGTVSDPHEIANVLGIEGVEYMLANGRTVPFKFNFGAPSCVPATAFETAGAIIDSNAIQGLLENPEIKYLAEMMNYPGVIFKDEEVLAKLAIAKKLGKAIDGHAPGLRGEDSIKYFGAGISTDHECYSYEEALEKLNLLEKHGIDVKILIREGSAAKNFNALIPLLSQFPKRIMFCSDDKHPDDLIEGHINQLAARAIDFGCNLFDVLQAACINPVEHYSLDIGILREGDPADFILTKNLQTYEVEETYIDGLLVASKGNSKIQSAQAQIINHFEIGPIDINQLILPCETNKVHVIKAVDQEIVTERFIGEVKVSNGMAQSNPGQDILKMVVVNRYAQSKPAIAFINGFGITSGAIASCVGHDSHNIIALGTDDDSICRAINLIIEEKGGIAAVFVEEEKILPLPIAGIMTNADAYETAAAYSKIDQFVKSKLACKLTAPFMTLSFMALLVIPTLKLGDKGLFDGEEFSFVELFVQE